jgi:exonuclease III
MRSVELRSLCIQETQLHGAYYEEELGFLICLSGELDAERLSNAGVGFIIAPWARASLVAFRTYSPRLASVRLRVQHGVLDLISARAPHSGRDCDERQHFFSELGAITKPTTTHSTTLVLGDFNAKLLQQGLGESDIIGDSVFSGGSARSILQQVSNRQLLIEYCIEKDMLVANTFFKVPVEEQITFRNLGTLPSEPISPDKFSQIDHVLCHNTVLPWVQDCRTDRTVALEKHAPIGCLPRSCIP